MRISDHFWITVPASWSQEVQDAILKRADHAVNSDVGLDVEKGVVALLIRLRTDPQATWFSVKRGMRNSDLNPTALLIHDHSISLIELRIIETVYEVLDEYGVHMT